MAADHREGMYAIAFSTNLGAGYGVVILENGRFRGGDSRMAYSGFYSLSGDMLSADIQVSTHTDNPKLTSSFGLETFTLALHGNFAEDPATLIGISPDAVKVDFRATLRKIHEPERAPELR
ncbi:hypothetical protein [Enterovirga sp. CN4-39]|uniref:hypothetical protein n=1 Tax=Enterovirga sp. CN4-39 TaxID=3400910 RepID=UPI003C124D21